VGPGLGDVSYARSAPWREGWRHCQPLARLIRSLPSLTSEGSLRDAARAAAGRRRTLCRVRLPKHPKWRWRRWRTRCATVRGAAHLRNIMRPVLRTQLRLPRPRAGNLSHVVPCSCPCPCTTVPAAVWL